jgi:hypothetical protein
LKKEEEKMRKKLEMSAKRNIIYDNKRSNIIIELDKDKIIFSCDDDNDWNEVFHEQKGERSVEKNKIVWRFNKDNKELKDILISMVEDDPLFANKLEEKEKEKEKEKKSLQERFNSLPSVANVKKGDEQERRVIYPRNEEEEERMPHKSLKIVDYTQYSLAIFTPFYRDWGNEENLDYINKETQRPFTNKEILEDKLGAMFNFRLKQKNETDKAPGWVLKKSDNNHMDFISSLIGKDKNGKDQDIRSFFEVKKTSGYTGYTNYNSNSSSLSSSTKMKEVEPPRAEVKVPVTPMDHFYSLFKELQASQPYPQRKSFDDEYTVIFGERDIVNKQIEKDNEKYEVVVEFSIKKGSREGDNKVVLLRSLE